MQCGARKDGGPSQAGSAQEARGGSCSSATAVTADGEGASATDHQGEEAEAVAGAGAATSSAPLLPGTSMPKRSQEKGQTPATHILRALHCGPRNNGKYDALYTLTSAWHAQLCEFFGLGESLPPGQIVSRSITGKSLFFIGSAALRLLTADAAAKFKLVNTGTRVLEKVDARDGIAFPFRLCQEGAAWLVPHMTQSSTQRIFASTADILQILQRRHLPVSNVRSATLREALLAARPGSIVLVHDVDGLNALPVGKPMPLVLAATRSSGESPMVELGVKAAEAISLYNRTANQPGGVDTTVQTPSEKDGPSVQAGAVAQ